MTCYPGSAALQRQHSAAGPSSRRNTPKSSLLCCSNMDVHRAAGAAQRQKQHAQRDQIAAGPAHRCQRWCLPDPKALPAQLQHCRRGPVPTARCARGLEPSTRAQRAARRRSCPRPSQWARACPSRADAVSSWGYGKRSTSSGGASVKPTRRRQAKVLAPLLTSGVRG